MSDKNFRVDDLVTWSSQAGGFYRTKVGRVVSVVEAKRDPRYFVPAGMSLDGPGMWRNHESYLVRVGNSNRLYWPRVSALRLYAQALGRLIAEETTTETT